jgi:hypothetical protein
MLACLLVGILCMLGKMLGWLTSGELGILLLGILCMLGKMVGWLEIHELGMFARFTRKMPGSWLGGECFFAGDIF